MLILAADTSTNAGSVALAEASPDGKIRVLVERCWDLAVVGTRRLASPNHSDRIVPEIEEILIASGIRHEELGGLACAVGPGSFTGLRVALSALKGIALARNLPLAGVSTFEALAWNVPFCGRRIVTLADARKSEIYGAAFDVGADGIPRRVREDQVTPAEPFLRSIAADGKPVVVLGDALIPYGKLIREIIPDSVALDGSASLPRAGNVARLGAASLLAGRSPANEAAAIAPTYLRRPEAEWKKSELPKPGA